jgi:hypothetical protein
MNTRAIGLFLILLLASCVKRIDFGPRGEIEDARTLLKLTDQEERRVLSLQGDAKLTVNSPQGSGTLSLYVAVQRPSSLHLETLDFFGKPLAVLVSDGVHFGLYQAQENRYYEGPASPENVSRFLPVVIPPNELARLLLGGVPQVEDPKPALTLDRGEGVYRVRLEQGPTVQTLAVDPTTLRVEKSEVRGTQGYDVTLEDFGDYGAVHFPRKLDLDAPSAKADLVLRYTQVSLNAPVDPVLFTASPPPGVPVVQVDAIGRPVIDQPLPESGSTAPAR